MLFIKKITPKQVPNTDNDCIDIEVFFDQSTGLSIPKYATWQYVTSGLCVAAIAAVNSNLF